TAGPGGARSVVGTRDARAHPRVPAPDPAQVAAPRGAGLRLGPDRRVLAPKVHGRAAQGQRAPLAPPWVRRPTATLYAEGVRPNSRAATDGGPGSGRTPSACHRSSRTPTRGGARTASWPWASLP